MRTGNKRQLKTPGRSEWRSDVNVVIAEALGIPLADLFKPMPMKGIAEIKKLARRRGN